MPSASYADTKAVIAGATVTSVDITACPAGDWVYCWVVLDAAQTAVTMTNWTLRLEGNEPVSSSLTHYALFRRKKVAGDTTFTISWPTSAKGTIGLIAWPNLHPTAPDEGAAVLLHTAGTNYPTPSATPAGPQRRAAMFTYSRSSTSGNKAIAFTPDAALVEQLDFNNSTAGGSPWVGQQIASSLGPVTTAAHTYTAVQLFTETHGAALILYLVPASLLFDFEEGTPPNLLTVAGDYLQVTGTAKYTDDCIYGSVALSSVNGGFITVPAPADVHSGVLYTRVLSMATGSARIMTCTDSLNAFAGMIRMHTSGVFDICDSATTRQAVSVATWSPEISYRTEYQIAGAGTARTLAAKVYVENSTTPIWDSGAIAVTAASANPVARVRLGAQGVTAGEVITDHVRLYDSLLWPGPYLPPFAGAGVPL
jgi:hypothetical protein